jgi:pilus assembly protein CpaF
MSVIAIVGTKGGTGASTLCVDVMTALTKTCSVAVVDGDLSASRSIAVLTDSVRAIDAVRTAQIAVLRKGRATIVEIAASIESAFTIQPADVEAVAAEVTASNDMVILDAAQPYAAAVRPFITRAARFVLVVEPTVLGISNARLAQIEMERFGIGRPHQALVIGGRSSAREISRGEIERVLGVAAIAEFGANADRRYEKAIEQFAAALRQMPTAASPLVLQPSMSTPIGDRRASRRRPVAETPAAPARPTLHAAPKTDTARRDARDVLKSEINDLLTKRLDFSDPARAVDDAGKLAELRAQVGAVVSELLGSHPGVGTAEDVADLRQEIIDEALGLGPLEDLLRDPSITEIMVNGAQRVFVERGGKIEQTAKRFTSERQLRLIIERIIAPIGRRIDESQPMVDARLADGSRVNAIVAPLALDGATLTIRRFPARRMNADDLVKIDALTPELVDFLRAAVEARLNIMVAGGTGSGKTTFLNVLSSFLPATERIVTIEDAAELSLAQTHVVRLESRPRNIQGAGEVTIRDLVRNALRMRPDRIIVGECRGGEALDMLQAMNTGHDGSLTTIHANSTRDAISRAETMVMMAGFDLPIRAIREQIASAVDLVVQLSRMRDGSRKLVSISEVVGLEGDVVTMQDLARYEQRGLDKDGRVVGDFVFTGVQPMCLRKFEEYGVTYDVRNLSNMTMRAVSW